MNTTGKLFVSLALAGAALTGCSFTSSQPPTSVHVRVDGPTSAPSGSATTSGGTTGTGATTSGGTSAGTAGRGGPGSGNGAQTGSTSPNGGAGGTGSQDTDPGTVTDPAQPSVGATAPTGPSDPVQVFPANPTTPTDPVEPTDPATAEPTDPATPAPTDPATPAPTDPAPGSGPVVNLQDQADRLRDLIEKGLSPLPGPTPEPSENPLHPWTVTVPSTELPSGLLKP